MAIQTPIPGYTSTTVLGEHTFADAVTFGAGVTNAAGLTGLTVAVPEAADDPGTTGQIAFDATHLYVCVDTDTWVRAELATWE